MSTVDIPIYERPVDEWLMGVIEELESRKNYGIEYAQAMEDVIAILTAKLNADKEAENE